MVDEPEDDSYLLHVGRTASNWALFEGVIDMAIWHLAGVDDKSGACMTSQISGSSRKLDALLALVDLHHGDDLTLLKNLRRIADQSRGLAERRNRVIHDRWRARDGKPSRHEVTARKRLVFRSVEVTEEELVHLADQIQAHTDALYDLMKPLLEFPDGDD